MNLSEKVSGSHSYSSTRMNLPQILKKQSTLQKEALIFFLVDEEVFLH